MTKEEKFLLLQDLSARVPYGVMVEQTLFPPSLADKEQRLKSVQANNVVQLYWYKYINEFVPIHCIKPYLRPMSSMTEGEKEEITATVRVSGKANIVGDIMLDYKRDYIKISETTRLLDWLNERHFDFRNLIEKGLALEAPADMYKVKEK